VGCPLPISRVDADQARSLQLPLRLQAQVHLSWPDEPGLVHAHPAGVPGYHLFGGTKRWSATPIFYGSETRWANFGRAQEVANLGAGLEAQVSECAIEPRRYGSQNYLS
jgi:hypothetical protein